MYICYSGSTSALSSSSSSSGSSGVYFGVVGVDFFDPGEYFGLFGVIDGVVGE